MKYFEIKGFSVVDYRDPSFAKYAIYGSNGKAVNRVFHELGDAVIYCIGLSNGCNDDKKLMVMIEAFNSLTTKKQ